MTSCHSYYGNMYGILPKTIYSLEKIKVKPTPIWIWNKYKGYKETNVMNGIKHIREHLQYNEMGWNIKNIVFDQGQLFDSCLYGPTLSQSFTFTPKFWIRPFFFDLHQNVMDPLHLLQPQHFFYQHHFFDPH